jgi:mitochondrial fission protein ELM1
MADMASLAWRGSVLGVAPPAAGDDESARTWSLATVMDHAVAGAPSLVISAGSRAASVALWLRERLECRVVNCMSPGIGNALRARAYDLAIVAEHDQPPLAPNIFPVLGAPHRLSPTLLRHAAGRWAERLDYLPHPRIALLIGGTRDNPFRGPDLSPALAHNLARKVARMAASRGGSVLATTSRRTGPEATEAVAAGLGRVLHQMYRWGEPGENPYSGFLALADAVVVTADSIGMLSEACATTVPVFVAAPELAGTRQKRLIAGLVQAGHARQLGRGLVGWKRTPLDEAGRVALEVRRRFSLD